MKRKRPCRMTEEPDFARGLMLRADGVYDSITFPVGRGAADLARTLGIVVGGTAAAIPVKDDSGSFIVFDAQGAMKGKPVNRAASLMADQILLGDCVVCPHYVTCSPCRSERGIHS